jgi:hypothetical protein
MNVSHTEIGSSKRDLPTTAVAELQQLALQLGEASSLARMVVVTLGCVRRVGLLMLRHAVEERDGEFRRSEVPVSCPKCQAGMKRTKNLRRVRRFTLLGALVYRRCGYKCSRCDERCFPLDAALEVAKGLRGHSLEFASSLVLLCVVVPFGKGCELFNRLAGFCVSTRLARALTFDIGTRLFAAEMKKAEQLWILRSQNPETFEPPPARLRAAERHSRVYVMTDNSKVGLQNGKRGRKAPKLKALRKQAQDERRRAARAAKRVTNGPDAPPAANTDLQTMLDDEGSWRDVRALLIFREEDLAQVSKTRRQIVHRRVVAHLGTKEEWLQLVHMAFHEEGVYTAHEVVVIADGGSGIWELIAELLPRTASRKVIEILDWYHAASHLWEVGRALKGCKTPQDRARCAAWVQPLLDYMAEGKVANVIQRLAKLTGLRGGAADAVRKCLKYFKAHRNRMRYAWCRKNGLLIGSGAIESVHAWVIQARCRLPGMRWSEAGINAMLRLRCSWASGRWDEDFASAACANDQLPRQIRAAA